MNPPRRSKSFFSSTEVGTLIESFRNDISVLAEGQAALRGDVSILKSDVKTLKDDMQIVKDALRVTLPEINTRLTALAAKIS